MATKTRTYERELEVALWWRDFRATNNAHFLPLLFDRHRYLVLKGGGGSGKSIFAGRKARARDKRAGAPLAGVPQGSADAARELL